LTNGVPIPKASINSFYLIFTDLDGTLLDHDTYQWKDASEALDLCRRRGVPVILVSSKTRAEINQIRNEMPISGPFISENGGGIFFSEKTLDNPPEGTVLEDGLWKWSLGEPYHILVAALREIRSELGWNLRGFSDMSVEEISRRTGLDHQASRLATMREFDEPFLILEKGAADEQSLIGAVKRRGFRVTIGGRFYHLQGKHDKGQAIEKLKNWYQQKHATAVSVALGDSPNDFDMLKRADIPVLVRSRRDFSELKQTIPHLRITAQMGPKGWNQAVLEILGENEVKR